MPSVDRRRAAATANAAARHTFDFARGSRPSRYPRGPSLGATWTSLAGPAAFGPPMRAGWRALFYKVMMIQSSQNEPRATTVSNVASSTLIAPIVMRQ